MWECKRYWYGAGNYGHLSYDKQHERLRELGDIEVGVGTLQATNERLAKAVNSSVDQLREWVKQQPRVHVDESPWSVLGLKEWLWVTAGRKFCRFHPGDTRSRAELVEQLGETNDFETSPGSACAKTGRFLRRLYLAFRPSRRKLSG